MKTISVLIPTSLFLKNKLGTILGDPGAVSGDGEKSKTGEKNFGRPKFFSPVLDFSPSPLTAPGSPRMARNRQREDSRPCYSLEHLFVLV